MADKTIRLTEELKWANLREAYFIGTLSMTIKDPDTGLNKTVTGSVNKLQDAITDGTIDALVKACADKMHDGDTYEVYRAMSRNLSSMQNLLAKKTYSHQKGTEELRYKTLRDYVTNMMASTKTRNAAGNVTGVSYWRWTMDQIKDVSISDAKTICSIYDNMASAKSKYPEKVAADSTFDDRFKVVSEMKTAALKLAKQRAKMHESADLINKLNAGEGVVFTAEEAAQLAKLLGKLNG